MESLKIEAVLGMVFISAMLIIACILVFYAANHDWTSIHTELEAKSLPYNNHSYLIMKTDRSYTTVVHDPDCKCLIRK